MSHNVMVTLIHLDHAGGARGIDAGIPKCSLGGGTSVGAWHMIDQTKLTAETVDVYGEENTRKHYCTIILVPEGRVLNEEDESLIDFHGRSLTFSRCSESCQPSLMHY